MLSQTRFFFLCFGSSRISVLLSRTPLSYAVAFFDQNFLRDAPQPWELLVNTLCVFLRWQSYAGACFADFGIKVTCADIDERKIRQLKAGETPFYEPGLLEKIQTNVEQGRLGFTTDVAAAIRDALVVIIAVGTPANRDGTPNLEAVETVAREIGRNLTSYKVVVKKSTVPPQTGDR